MIELKDKIKILNDEYNVNHYYYPNMTMGIDSPTLDYEILSIEKLLTQLSLSPSIENINIIMEAKKKCIELYNSGRLKESANKYDELILKPSKPIGGIGPLAYFFATAFTCFLIFLYKYSGSFGEEAGKLSAQKLFKKDKEDAIEVLNSTKQEIDFMEEEIISLSKKGEDLEIISKTIRRIKK